MADLKALLFSSSGQMSHSREQLEAITGVPSPAAPSMSRYFPVATERKTQPPELPLERTHCRTIVSSQPRPTCRRRWRWD